MPFFLLGKFNPPIFLHQVLPAMISLFHFLKLPMDVTPTSLLENQPGIWTATRSKSLPRVSWMFRNINETYNWRVQNKTLPETKALRVFFPPEHGCLGLMTTFLFGMAGWLGRMFQGRLFVSGTFFIVKFRWSVVEPPIWRSWPPNKPMWTPYRLSAFPHGGPVCVPHMNIGHKPASSVQKLGITNICECSSWESLKLIGEECWYVNTVHWSHKFHEKSPESTMLAKKKQFIFGVKNGRFVPRLSFQVRNEAFYYPQQWIVSSWRIWSKRCTNPMAIISDFRSILESISDLCTPFFGFQTNAAHGPTTYRKPPTNKPRHIMRVKPLGQSSSSRGGFQLRCSDLWGVVDPMSCHVWVSKHECLKELVLCCGKNARKPSPHMDMDTVWINGLYRWNYNLQFSTCFQQLVHCPVCGIEWHWAECHHSP